ncbi:retrograde regulation protein 2 [Xylariaceae sp. FL1019]|nr:retrograde regulation protein 2 [Xylariaceae sp. FL1019]
MEDIKPDVETVGDTKSEHQNLNDIPSPHEEKAVIRKLDWHLMPMIFAIYSLSVLDRSNLGNAHVAGLDESIGLKGNQYSTLGTLFYVTYIIFQLFGAAGWKHFPAHIWVACIVLSFATISSSQAAVKNYAGMVVLRLLLGATEALYSAVPVYLSFFYPKNKVGFRQGIFLSGSALANAYGGALGYAITHIQSPKIEPWRILFLIEGLPTLILVVVAFFFFPDDIESAKFLSGREKEVVKHMVSRGQTADVEDHIGLRVNDFFAAFKDWKSYVTGIMYFSVNVCFASLPLFVPTIIAEIGTFSKLEANGLSAPPYLLTFILIIIISFISDATRLRGPFVCFFGIVSAIGFLLLATTEAAAPRYIGVYLAITVFVCVAILLVWVTNNHNTESKRAGGFAIFGAFGQAGPLLGTNIFPESDSPYYRTGSWVSFSFCVLVAVTSAIFSFLLHNENKKLDKRAITEGREPSENEFRYVI